MTLLHQGQRGHGTSPGDREGDESHLAREFGELAHLLFEWPIRQAPRLALPCCILLAAIIQAGMIFLFSISYQTPSEIRPDSPQIYFLPTDSPSARAIAPWLEANDPAVFSPQYDTRSALPAPPPLTYRPSYEEPPPPLRPLPPALPEIVEPPLLPPMTGIVENHPALPKPAPFPGRTPGTLPTVVRWLDDLASRKPSASPPGTVVAMPQADSATAQPALYEVGVSAEGLPLHCVLLDSSGDPASDEAGSVWVHAQRFQPADQETWGRVLILWGASSSATRGEDKPSGAISATTP